MTTHYSKAQNPSNLYPWAREAARELIVWAEENNYCPILCYSGMSGISTATAISIALYIKKPSFSFGMVYVRKAEEESHGNSTEYNIPYNTSKKVMVFVDDFVATGTTFERVKEAIELRHGRVTVFKNCPKLLSGRDATKRGEEYSAEIKLSKRARRTK